MCSSFISLVTYVVHELTSQSFNLAKLTKLQHRTVIFLLSARESGAEGGSIRASWADPNATVRDVRHVRRNCPAIRPSHGARDPLRVARAGAGFVATPTTVL